MANIERGTGRPFGEWVDIVRASGLEKHGQMVDELIGWMREAYDRA